MKKLLVALMAVFMFVSCGSSDEGGSGMSPNQVADEYYGILNTYNNEVVAAMAARDAEMYVKAVEKYSAAMDKLASKAPNFDESKVDPKKAESIKKRLELNAQNDKNAKSMFSYELRDGELGERYKKAMDTEDGNGGAGSTGGGTTNSNVNGSKKVGSNNSGALTPNQAADEIYAIAVTYNKEMAAAVQANDAEMYVKAVEKYSAAQKKMAPKVQNLDESKVDPKKAKVLNEIFKANGELDKHAQSMFYDEIYNGELSARFKKANGIE